MDYRIYVVSSAPETCCLTVICETQMKIIITTVRTTHINPLFTHPVMNVVVFKKLCNPVYHVTKIFA